MLARARPVSQQLPKKARTRLALLRAAVDLLGHEDGRLARVEDIVQSVGMTRTTFYNYFVSREDIFDKGEIIAGNETMQRELLALIRQANRA